MSALFGTGPDQLHAAALLSALCRGDPFQRGRARGRSDAHGGGSDPLRRFGLDGIAADGDVRLAGKPPASTNGPWRPATLRWVRLLLGGRGAYSIDNVLLHRKPALAATPWFR
jgi:hypothetical protein